MLSRAAAAVTMTAALLLAGGPALAQGPAPQTVKISNLTFAPQTITVTAGATVTWTNDDDLPHTVVAIDKSFRSKALDTGDRFSFTFAKPGQYAFFCSIHPMMTGKVVVK
jgi:plastocyanin